MRHLCCQATLGKLELPDVVYCPLHGRASGWPTLGALRAPAPYDLETQETWAHANLGNMRKLGKLECGETRKPGNLKACETWTPGKLGNLGNLETGETRETWDLETWQTRKPANLKGVKQTRQTALPRPRLPHARGPLEHAHVAEVGPLRDIDETLHRSPHHTSRAQGGQSGIGLL